MMLNEQSTCDQIDYDVPPSTCGYPIYFSLCVDGQFNRPINSVRSLNSSSSSSTLPPQQNPSRFVNSDNITFNNNISDVHQYKTLPSSVIGYDDITGNRNQNIVIPNRDFNFNQLLKLSEQKPNMSNSGQIYDVPQPHPRPNAISSTNGNHLPDSRSDNVYPAQLVITTINYDTPPPPSAPSSSSTSIDKESIGNHSLKHLPRSGSYGLSRSSLPPGINCNTSLTSSLTTSQPISNFGSTSSLPSPIPHLSSLEKSSISFSSCDNNNNTKSINRCSLVDQSIGGSSETYDVPPNRETGKQVTGNGCSNCGKMTSKDSPSGFQRKTSCNTLIDDRNLNYDAPPSSCLIINNQLAYDIPKTTLSRNHDQSFSSSSSQRSVKAITAITRSYSSNNNNNNSLSSSSSSLSSHQFDNYNIDSHGLDLNLDGGLILANRLENESLEAIGKLIGISSTVGWRKWENLEPKLSELTKRCSQLKCVIRELEVFTDGIYMNSLKISNGRSSINNKLHRLAKQLKDSANIVISTIRSIDSRGWSLNELSIIGNTRNESRRISRDELDQLIACMPGLKEDIKHIMSLVKSYGNLLFPVEKQVDKQQQHQPTTNDQSNSCLSNTIGSVSSSTLTFKSTSGLVEYLPSKPPPPPVPPKPPINLRPLPLVPRDNLSSSNETTIKKVDLDLGKVTLKSGSAKEEDDDKQGNQQVEYDEEEVNDEDDDYASLETRDKISQRNLLNSNISLTPTSPNKVFYSQLINNNQKVTPTGDRQFKIDSNLSIDQLLSFYCPLLEEQNQNLRKSVNALISAINTKQLPKVLISLSKLVVIAGQQMIFIGDTINRNVSGEISCYVAKCSNSLCQSLKHLITNTKKASNLFPSAPALQDLLDSIVQVSIHSDQLTLLKEHTFLD